MAEVRRPTNEAEAIAWLVERVPELRPLLDEHVRDMDELLPYVVFESDFRRWFVSAVRAGDHDPARRFVEAVEPLMTTTVKPPANDRVWNLAAVCFVEGLVRNRMWCRKATASPIHNVPSQSSRGRFRAVRLGRWSAMSGRG
jgi:hypothetical protein